MLLAGNPPTAGLLTNNLPVTEIVSTFRGEYGSPVRADLYHHVHLLPAKIALGNSLSTQIRQVEVWNAHFALQPCRHHGQNDGGITLAAPANPPTTWLECWSHVCTTFP